jgi:hypothetical protein
MTEKTYWGLSEIDINRFWKSLPDYKDKLNVYLTLKEEYTEPYEYYLEKVLLIDPDFTEQTLIDIHIDMIDFKDNSDFTDYNDYKIDKNKPTQEELDRLELERKLKVLEELKAQQKALEDLILGKSNIS